MKVAVSGVGGGVGQSIMKALTISSLPVEILAIDVQPISAGLFRAPEALLLAKPESPNGLGQWERSLQANGVTALIPGSDHDLLPLASVRDRWASTGVCQTLVSDLELVQACRDKAATCQMLEREDLPFPRSVWDLTVDEAVSWARSNGYPVVLKPRNGSASRDVHVIQDEDELRFFFPRTPEPILQEHLSDSGKVDEFTCSVFVDRDGSPVGTFMARRQLSAGTTSQAEVGFWPEINELMLALGTKLRPRGVLNAQLRMTQRGPVPFELNIRCSGTSAIRAYFGYNEPEMLLRHYVLGEQLERPTVRPGYAIRYWNEVFLEGASLERLKSGPNGIKGNILAWP